MYGSGGSESFGRLDYFVEFEEVMRFVLLCARQKTFDNFHFPANWY